MDFRVKGLQQIVNIRSATFRCSLNRLVVVAYMFAVFLIIYFFLSGSPLIESSRDGIKA
jgi:hypothetical protein